MRTILKLFIVLLRVNPPTITMGRNRKTMLKTIFHISFTFLHI